MIELNQLINVDVFIQLYKVFIILHLPTKLFFPFWTLCVLTLICKALRLSCLNQDPLW